MFKLGYQLRPTPVGRLLAAAVGRCAAGIDARSGVGAPKLGGRQVGTVEIDDAETAGDFERAPAAASGRQRHLGNDSGIGAPGGIVEALTAEAVSRFDIAAIEIQRRPRDTATSP